MHSHEQTEHSAPAGHTHGHGHGHSHGAVDAEILASERGIRATKLSLAALLGTALVQLVIVGFTGSVALLADTIHNFGDAATALPLWAAFTLSRRLPTMRFTYGYGRAEDLAGLLIVAASGTGRLRVLQPPGRHSGDRLHLDRGPGSTGRICGKRGCSHLPDQSG